MRVPLKEYVPKEKQPRKRKVRLMMGKGGFRGKAKTSRRRRR